MQGSRHQRTSSAEYRRKGERALLEFKKTETSYSERQWGAPLSPSHIRTGVFTAHFLKERHAHHSLKVCVRFPTSNWGLTFLFSQESLLNCKCHSSLAKRYLKTFQTYPNTSIRTWWIYICSQFLHLFMPPPFSRAPSFNSPCPVSTSPLSQSFFISYPHPDCNYLSHCKDFFISPPSLQFLSFPIQINLSVHNSPPVICFHKVILLINYFYNDVIR